MKHSFIIIEASEEIALETRKAMSHFPDYNLVNVSFTFEDALDAILKFRPAIVFLSTEFHNFSFSLISEVHRYLSIIPKFIITSTDTSLAMEAIKYEVYDYLIKPQMENHLRKCLLKFEKGIGSELREELQAPKLFSGHDNAQDHLTEDLDAVEKEIIVSDWNLEAIPPLTICVKSYGDYRFISSETICYLKADNNSTDIYMKNGDVITAFKTLKNFETTLPLPFVRVHNSYIINIKAITRIHTGNSVCHLYDGSVKIPFSKSYKINVDKIIRYFEQQNYLEF